MANLNKKEIYWKYRVAYRIEEKAGNLKEWQEPGNRNEGSVLLGVAIVMNELLLSLSVHSEFSVHVEDTCLSYLESYPEPSTRRG